MAHTGIFATSAECISKMGKGYDSTSVTEAMINQWCSEAESYINVLCKRNFSDEYATLNIDWKKILTEACSCLVGIYAIVYNPRATYGSMREAENLININGIRFENCIKLLSSDGAADIIK